MRLLPDPSSDVSVGVVVSPAAPSGSFVRCVGWTCCVAGGSFRILRPMCRWDLLCRRRLLQDPSSDVSAGLAVSNADPSGSFVKCVARICNATGVSFRIRRRRLLPDPSPDALFKVAVAGGSFWSIRPLCRLDVLCRRRLRAERSPDVSVGFWLVAGSSFRILRPMCRRALLCSRRLLPIPSSDVLVGFAVLPAAPSGSFARWSGGNGCVPGGCWTLHWQT
jgi:hypothetical protein